MYDAQATIVSSTIGKTLVSACRTDYLIDGIPNEEDLGPLQLSFADNSTLVLSLVPDGESVTSDTNPLIFSPETWFQVDLSDHLEWQQIIGRKVTGCDQWIWDGEVRTGWRFWFEGRTLCYLNAGDNAKIEINSEPIFPVSGCIWDVITPSDTGR